MKKLFCLFLALAMTLSCLSGLSLAATVIATVQTPGSATVNATSVSEMTGAVSETGESVITLKSSIAAPRVNLPYSCTLDLGGFTLNATEGNGVTVAKAGSKNAVTCIKNGVIDAKVLGIRLQKGAISLKNVIVLSRTSSAVGIYETSTAHNDHNRIEGCTLVSLVSSALSFHEQNGKQRDIACTLNSSTLISAKASGNIPSPVVTAIGSNTGTVTLEEGVRIYHYTPIKRASSNLAQNDHYWRDDHVTTLGLTARAEHRFTDITIPELDLTLKSLDGWYSYKQPEGTDVEKLQQAVVETALAYYRKGKLVQYDWANMTWQSRYSLGISRMNTGAAPEDAAYDFTVNTNCSDWACDIYLNAFDYAPSGSRRHNQVRYLIKNKRDTDDDVFFRYFANLGDPMPQEVKDQIPGLRDLLQPGDLINVMVPAGGHTMIYIGDYIGDGNKYYIHSTGGGTPLVSNADGDVAGKDSLHTNGTISIATVDRLFEASYENGNYLLGEGVYEISIIRPVNLLSEADLTPSALSRLAYPGLDIDRSADAPLYSSVETGSEITVSITLKNTGPENFRGLKVTEALPAGAELVAGTVGDGGTITAGGVSWELSLDAGKAVTLSYRVKVTAKAGETVALPGGTVADIPTRELTYTVLGSPWIVSGGSLSSVTAENSFSNGDTAFANNFYKTVYGVDLQLPAMDSIITNLFTQETQKDMRSSKLGGKMLVARDRSQLTAEYQRIFDMILPDHQAGQSVYIPVNLECGRPENRVSTYLESNYMPGDIFLCTTGTSYLNVQNAADVVVYIYLGNGRVAVWDATGSAKGTKDETPKGFQIMSFTDTIHRNLRLNVMLCLRPALLQDLVPSSGAVLAQNGTYTFCTTVQEAADKVGDDGKSTVTLLQDAKESITAPYSFILDLNGHTLTSGDTAVAVKAAGSKNTVTLVKNGTISAANTGLSVQGGTLQVRNAQIKAATATSGSKSPDDAAAADKSYAAIWQYFDASLSCTSLDRAVGLITPDGLSTITLLQDITDETTTSISAPYSFTLDLNGHTLSSPNHNCMVVQKAGTECSVTTVKNGTLKGNPIALRVNGGGVHVMDATLFSTGGAALCLYTTTAEFNKSNLVERSTILSDTYFAISFNRNDADQTDVAITVRDSDLITTKPNTFVLGTRNKGQSGTVILGTGVNLCSILDTTYHHSRVTISGEEVTAQTEPASIAIPEPELSLEGLSHWKTPDSPVVVPEEPAPEEPAPAEPAPPASEKPDAPVPEDPSTDTPAPEEPSVDAPAREKSAPVGLILGICGGIIAAAAVVLLLKKKKK